MEGISVVDTDGAKAAGRSDTTSLAEERCSTQCPKKYTKIDTRVRTARSTVSRRFCLGFKHGFYSGSHLRAHISGKNAQQNDLEIRGDVQGILPHLDIREIKSR
jgi:hypothetical protein